MKHFFKIDIGHYMIIYSEPTQTKGWASFFIWFSRSDCPVVRLHIRHSQPDITKLLLSSRREMEEYVDFLMHLHIRLHLNRHLLVYWPLFSYSIHKGSFCLSVLELPGCMLGQTSLHIILLGQVLLNESEDQLCNFYSTFCWKITLRLTYHKTTPDLYIF